VLLHAGLIVRHNAMALSAHLLQQELITSLALICNSSGAAMASDDVANIPSPTGGSGDCPICTGVMGASGLLPEAANVVIAFDRPSHLIAVTSERIAPRLFGAWPPSRGPPAFA
jgi:hypothetical protein